jgi:superfamily II DNA or RNA helicase
MNDLTDRFPELVRAPGRANLRALLDVSNFGYRRFTLATLPERLYTGLDDAQRPESLIQVPATQAVRIRTPIEALCDAVEPAADAWPTETRRSLARLEALWLLVEDPYRRLDASRVEPLAHQAALVEHILNTPGLERVLIGDEVGLGKTIEAGLLIQRLAERQSGLRVLYLTEARLVENVVEEFERIGLRPRRWTAEAQEARLAPGDSDRLVVASIHRAVVNQDLVGASGPWDMLIVDEAHHLTDWSPEGNDPQQRMRLVRTLVSTRLVRAGRIILLSGTPHQGSRERFANLLRLLGQGARVDDARGRVIYRIKDDITGWDGEPLFPIRQVNPHTMVRVSAEYRRWMDLVHQLLAPGPGASRASGWRRAQALQWCASSPQAGVGFLVRLAFRSGLRWRTSPALRTALTALRPYRGGAPDESIEVLEQRISGADVELEEDPDQSFHGGVSALEAVLELGAQLMRDDAFGEKVHALFELLDRNPEEKFVVFAQPIETVYTLRRRLEQRYGRGTISLIVGGQDARERSRAITQFVETRSVRALVSSRSGGEGINLQVARRLVHFDVPWNPMEMEQRVGRVHRYGGADTVIVDTFVLEGSREERVLQRARARLALIVTDIDRSRVELLFARTLALVPSDQLTQIMIGENIGPLTPDEENRLDHIVTEGYRRLQETEAEYRARTVQLRNPEPGAAGFPDLESWLVRHGGATPVTGWRKWILSRQQGAREPRRVEAEAALFRLTDGRITFASPENAIGVTGPAGESTRPTRVGLNDSLVAERLRQLADADPSPSGAGLSLLFTGDWQAWTSEHGIGEAFARGAIVAVYLVRSIATSISDREIDRRLMWWLVAADGKSSIRLPSNAAAALIRLLREPRPKLKRPELDRAVLLKFNDERIAELRQTAQEGALSAVFPIAAIWIEPTADRLTP